MELNAQTITELNVRYKPLSPRKRMLQLFADFDKVLVTSSFGTTSALVLHLVHMTKPDHPVHFIDTRYLFSQTHKYRDQLTEHWGLNIVDIYADEAGHRYTRDNALWKTEPDVCCGINKTMPVEDIRTDYDVWVAGLIGYQNAFRESLDVFEMKAGTLRFYPLVDISEQEVATYFERYQIPRHPLQYEGYGSVGCTHCTVKGKGRSGRWLGNMKTECGLHT